MLIDFPSTILSCRYFVLARTWPGGRGGANVYAYDRGFAIPLDSDYYYYYQHQ